MSTPDNIDIAFQAFMEAVKAEAEGAARHKINSQKEAINKYIEIIKNLESKLHQKQDQSLIKKFFNFQET